MSSPTTTTTIPAPNLSSLGHYLASHIHSQLTTSLALALRIISQKALFSKTSFRAAKKDFLHDLSNQAESIIFNYARLYESLGKTLFTPWNLALEIVTCFRTISEWVLETEGPAKRNMRNDIAHCCGVGKHYVDIEGYLTSGDESDSCAQRGFSASRLWELLESELPPLVEELKFAVKIFEEQIRHMPIEARKPREVKVVEDMSTPEIPAEWSEEGEWEEQLGGIAEENPVGWDVASTWEGQSGVEEIDVDIIVQSLEKLSIQEADDEGYESEW